jgi:hypothetical protein
MTWLVQSLKADWIVKQYGEAQRSSSIRGGFFAGQKIDVLVRAVNIDQQQ